MMNMRRAGQVRERDWMFWRMGAALLGLLAWTGLAVAPRAAMAIPPEVESQIDAARSQFQPITEEALSEWREEIREAAEELKTFLNEGGSEEDTQLWWEFLRLGPALEQLERDHPSLRRLGESAAQFYQHEDGLHLRPFTRLRDALATYINLAAMARHPNLRQEYLRQLDNLKGALEKLDADPTDGAAAERVGRILGFFGRMGQPEKLVEAVRSSYFHYNLVAHLSSKMVSEGIDEPVTEPVEVADNIMGTSIYGSGQIKAQVSSTLLPADDYVRVRLSLEGEATTENVGYNRSVKIWSNSWTSLWASKEVRIRPTGIETSPADAEAATSTDVYALSAPSCLVEKIAWKRVRKTKGQAEVVAARHAAGRLAEDMDERVRELLATARRRYQTQFRQPLLRRAAWPARFDLRSTARAILVGIMQADVSQASAATPAPPYEEDRDVVVRLHESFVSNFSRAMIGGVTLTDEQLVEIMENAEMEIPDELKITPDKPPWSIRFSTSKPVSAVFRDGKIQFAIFGQRFQQGETVVDGPIRLSATYTIQWNQGGARLVRQGEVAVEFVNLDRLGAEEIALRRVMRRKFEALFKPEFDANRDIRLPGRWADAGNLHLVTLDPSDGWLSVDMILRDAKDETADRVASAVADRAR